MTSFAFPAHRHHLCRARRYCHEVEPCAEALHAQVERLVQQAGSQADASVALYYFNASLYLLRVLKGNTTKKHQDGQNLQGADTEPEPKDSEVSQGQPLPRTLPQPSPCSQSDPSSLIRTRLLVA